MSFSLQGKAAIVTGGASGIGLAIVERLVANGVRVLVVDLRSSGAGSAKRSGAHFFVGDVSVEKDLELAFQEAKSLFGEIHILVSNAGIQPLGVRFQDLTGPLLDRTFGVNVNGVAFGLKHAARSLAQGGRVVNLASFVGILGVPGGTAYAASKAAVGHLTKLGALELAPRQITVNAISPGTILTPAVTDIPNNPEIPFVERRTPLRRLGRPEEVAALCHFLVSDEAAYITGQNISIDGGITAGWTEYDLVSPANVQAGRWADDV